MAARATMSETGRQPESISARDARERFDELVDRVARDDERIVVERDGKPVVAMVSARDLDRLHRIDADLAERRRILERFGEPFKDVPPEEIEREVARAIAEVRADRRAERERVGGVIR